ncbi:MAG: DUF2911 domain-containing protein [Bacteroidetes bacterium]|nr:MAG: DUF2911 domain-containing protein [Bacteroidota bacterium]
MKKVFLSFAFLAVFALTNSASAQIQTPAPSPLGKLEQVVGLTNVAIEYSRPAKKGRELFVEVEKWGKIWRTGANASTKITFSDDVKLEGKEVPAGTYAIYSIPDQENWTVMLYKDLTLGGNVNRYDEAQEFTRFQVKTKILPLEVENLTFFVDNIKSNSATLGFAWGKYAVPMKLEVEVDSKVMDMIEKTMAGPSRNDYYQAAHYYYNAGKDLRQALEWVRKANEMGPRYWQLRLEAQIYAKLGETNHALAKISESSKLAREAGNEDYAAANDRMAAEWRMDGGKEKGASKG